MAGDVTVGVVNAALSGAPTGFTDYTISGFGTPKACIILVDNDESDNTSVKAESRMSIGFSDFTDDYCITHQDEDNSAKVDCDARKSNTSSYIILTTTGTVDITGAATTITDGVRLTNTDRGSVNPMATVIMFGGADLKVDLVRATINSSQDGTVTPTVTLDDNDDKLIFFIGTDISAEDSSSSGINSSFGVCHASGSDGGGWTFVQRCLGWASDHNNADGTPFGIATTDRVLDMITEAGIQDWGLEVTALSASGNTLTLTTRDTGAGAGMEVYLLVLDLDDRKAKVGNASSPTSGTSWTPSVSLGFTPQYVGLMLHKIGSGVLDTIRTASSAEVFGISSNTGSGEETCHSWQNQDNAATTNTASLFRSRVIDYRKGNDDSISHDHSHSSFNSGDWTYTINTENETTVFEWFYWTIEEAAGGDTPMVAAAGAFTLGGVASNLLWKHQMTAALGTYALGGVAATTSKGFLMTAAQGTFTLGGVAATFSRTHIMVADFGTFTLGVVAANTLWGHLVDAALGTFSLTGIAAVMTKDTPMTAALGTFSLGGVASNLLWNHLVTAALGTFTLSGVAADTRVGFTMPADAGAFTLTGPAANLLWAHVIDAALGTFTFTGIAAVTSRDVPMVADLGTFSLGGIAANTLVGHLMIAEQGTFILTGIAANTLLSLVMVADQGTFTLTGIAAVTTVDTNPVMLADQGTFLLTGNAAITTDSGGALGTLIIPIGGRRRRSR